MIGELKNIANTPHSPILIKKSAGVDDSGQESGVHPDSDVEARVHEWDEAVEALVDCFALAGSSMDNRVCVRAKAKLPRELREVREERCLRNLLPEVALNDQSLPVNVRGDSSERRLVHATLTLMRSPAGGGRFISVRHLPQRTGSWRSRERSSVSFMARAPCSTRAPIGPTTSFGSTSVIQTTRLRPSASAKTCIDALWCVARPPTAA